MATTAFPATAIFDSGATGRDLIQAADQAAAQAAIGIDPSDYGLLDSDNTWTGDNTFDEPITASQLAGTSSLMLTAGGGSPTYFKFGTNLSWIVDTTSIRPTDSLGSRDIGLYNRRVGDVMAFRFGATESMTIYKVGNETETTNTETLETKWDSTKNSWVMRPKYSGSGTYRDFAIESSISNRAYIKFGIGGSSVALGYGYHYTGGISHLSIGSSYIQIGKEMYPVTSLTGTLSLGKTTNRWGLVASVDADISGTIEANIIKGAVEFNNNASNHIIVNASQSGTNNALLNSRGNKFIITAENGFNNNLGQLWLNGVGGTFLQYNGSSKFVTSSSGVSVQTGNSLKLFNLGDSHTNTTNTEYLEIEGDTSIGYYKIQPKYTGTGRTVQTLRILAVQGSHISLYGGGQFAYTHAGVQHLYCDAGGVSITDLDISGTLKLADGSVTAPSYSFGSQSTMGICRVATNQLNIVAGASYGLNVSTGGMFASSNMHIGWRSTTNLGQGAAHDTYLARDATGIIAQRKPNQVQAFRVYGDYTDASNGEWLQMDHGVTNPTRSTIASMANGTGTVRTIDINYGTSVRFKGDSAFSYIYGSSGGYIFYGANKLRGQSGISIDIGESTNRFANGYFVAGDFSGTVTANAFVGDGSGLTNLPGGGNPFDQSLNTTDSPSFVDADISGTLTTDLIQGGESLLKLNESANQFLNIWNAAGSTQYYSFRNNSFLPKVSSIKLGLPVSTARWLEVHAVAGSYENLNVETGGSFKFYNLGDSHTNTTNTESMSLYSTSNVNYFYSAATGSGTVRDLRIGSASNNIWFRSAFGIMAFIANGSPKMEVTGSGVLIVNSSNLFPWTDNASLCGKTDKRWSAVNSYDADFIGTTTLRTFDDGAGNSSSVATENSGSDSFFLHRTWTGTSGGNSSWIGLKNDYNSTGTAASWIGLSPNTLRLEIANGLRAVWQLSGNQHRLNLNFYPFADNTWQIGYSGAIWTEVWQGAAKIRGSRVDTSNYGYLSIEPDGDDYLIKANSLGTTADAGIKIQTSQLSAAGNQPIVLDADYNGVVSFYFGGNNRGYWSKDTLQPNVQVRTTVAYDINRNWNNASTVYQGYEANITDTASDTESSLLNLKVGGTSYLRLRKDGRLLFEKNGGSAAIVQNAGGISIVGDNGSTVQSFDQYYNYTYKTFRPISDNQHLGYVSRRFLIKANDIFSKGKIRSYNLGDETATDAEYLNLHWLSDHAYLTCENTGTGTARQFSIGTHTNGSIRFNHGTNIIRFSVGGVTASKMYLNSTGLTLYGVLLPQGQKTRDIGTTAAQWRELFVETVTASGDIDVAGDLNGGDANFTGQVTANEFVGDGSGLTGLPSGSSTLSGLTDTNVSSPANGQLLIYDAVSSKWDNAALTSTGGTISFTAGAGTLNLEASGGQGPSDRRLKDNIKSIENCLDKVLKMMPVEFTWKDELKDVHLNTGSDIGFIAQDIEEIEPKLVGERKDYKTLQYEKFAPLIVGAIKELYKQIEDLKN